MGTPRNSNLKPPTNLERYPTSMLQELLVVFVVFRPEACLKTVFVSDVSAARHQLICRNVVCVQASHKVGFSESVLFVSAIK
jgi:hypothetical protein